MKLLDLSDPKNRRFLLRFFWAVSTFMVILGFLLILLYWNA
jgi:hypothetical protein